MVPDRCIPEPDVMSAFCPSRRLLSLIADKWTVFVILVLARGRRRHGELQREVSGISQKMLTQTLRTLEREGFVARTVYPVVPPKVEYALTPRGETLLRPLEGLKRWAEEMTLLGPPDGEDATHRSGPASSAHAAQRRR